MQQVQTSPQDDKNGPIAIGEGLEKSTGGNMAAEKCETPQIPASTAGPGFFEQLKSNVQQQQQQQQQQQHPQLRRRASLTSISLSRSSHHNNPIPSTPKSLGRRKSSHMILRRQIQNSISNFDQFDMEELLNGPKKKKKSRSRSRKRRSSIGCDELPSANNGNTSTTSTRSTGHKLELQELQDQIRIIENPLQKINVFIGNPGDNKPKKKDDKHITNANKTISKGALRHGGDRKKRIQELEQQIQETERLLRSIQVSNQQLSDTTHHSEAPCQNVSLEDLKNKDGNDDDDEKDDKTTKSKAGRKGGLPGTDNRKKHIQELEHQIQARAHLLRSIQISKQGPSDSTHHNKIPHDNNGSSDSNKKDSKDEDDDDDEDSFCGDSGAEEDEMEKGQNNDSDDEELTRILLLADLYKQLNAYDIDEEEAPEESEDDTIISDTSFDLENNDDSFLLKDLAGSSRKNNLQDPRHEEYAQEVQVQAKTLLAHPHPQPQTIAPIASVQQQPLSQALLSSYVASKQSTMLPMPQQVQSNPEKQRGPEKQKQLASPKGVTKQLPAQTAQQHAHLNMSAASRLSMSLADQKQKEMAPQQQQQQHQTQKQSHQRVKPSTKDEASWPCSCGLANQGRHKCCVQCGASQSWSCCKCETSNPRVFKFCINCGISRQEGELQRQEAMQQAEAEEEEEKVWGCLDCDFSSNNPRFKFCVACGASRKTEPVTATGTAATPSKSISATSCWECYACHFDSNDGVFCVKCGVAKI